MPDAQPNHNQTVDGHSNPVYYPQPQNNFPMAELQAAQVESRQNPAMYYQQQANNFNITHHFPNSNQPDNRQIYYQAQSTEFLMNQFQSSQVDPKFRSSFWY